MLVGKDINKSYGSLAVLKDVSISIQEAEIISIVGASGAGKSTLLHILGTLDKPDSGELTLDSKDLLKLKNADLSLIRNQELGFIFQFHNLMAELTALENVCLPAWINKEDKVEKAKDILSDMGLKDRMNHLPSELSGGEQQRVAVARALINSPNYIFADEPSGNLDTKNAQELHDMFFTLRDKYKSSFIIVTHNETLAKKSDRTIELKDGRIVN